jgi:hypothetical protein
MDGDIGEILDTLSAHFQAERLKSDTDKAPVV